MRVWTRWLRVVRTASKQTLTPAQRVVDAVVLRIRTVRTVVGKSPTDGYVMVYVGKVHNTETNAKSRPGRRCAHPRRGRRRPSP